MAADRMQRSCPVFVPNILRETLLTAAQSGKRGGFGLLIVWTALKKTATTKHCQTLTVTFENMCWKS
jgi:hypothetical protein